jgi:putative FmdB family regulatory protein
MPTYEYRCKDCGHEFDVQQSFHDEPLTECPSCKGALKKKFGSVGIAFKGSGFYKNDSRGTSSTTTTPASTDTGSKATPADGGSPTPTPTTGPTPASTPASADSSAKSTPSSSRSSTSTPAAKTV